MATKAFFSPHLHATPLFLDLGKTMDNNAIVIFDSLFMSSLPLLLANHLHNQSHITLFFAEKEHCTLHLINNTSIECKREDQPGY